MWEKEEGQADGHDGGADERRCYQSQVALLISSRPWCLLTLNDTLVGPMASLRWQHGRPPLLKCKSGFNLKQSRPAEIIFLPSSQVLPSLLPFLLPSPPSFPPFIHPPLSLSLPPCSSISLTPGVLEMEGVSLEEATDKGKGGGGRGRKRARRKGAAVLTPAFCPDEGAEEHHHQARG